MLEPERMRSLAQECAGVLRAGGSGMIMKSINDELGGGRRISS